jgi:hypothetical protein
MPAENFDLSLIEDVIMLDQKFALRMHNMMIKKWLLCNKLAKQ